VSAHCEVLLCAPTVSLTTRRNCRRHEPVSYLPVPARLDTGIVDDVYTCLGTTDGYTTVEPAISASVSCNWLERLVPEMTCYVSNKALNSTHSLVEDEQET